MKTLLTFGVVLMMTAAVTLTAQAEEVWTGDAVTFTKEDGADWTLPANQDRITDDVWITREFTNVLFNIAQEAGPDRDTSPANTEWAVGAIEDYASLTYETFLGYGEGDIGGIGWTCCLSQPSVLHLIAEDIYIPIQFNFWSCCGAGGFSYTRGSPPDPTATEKVSWGSVKTIYR